MFPSFPINPSRANVDEKKSIPGTDLIIHRYAILSTNSVTFQVYRPFVFPKDRIDSPYSSYTIIDGEYWGDITTADLPPEIDELPVGPERIAAAEVYHQALDRLALSYAQVMYPDDFTPSPYATYPLLTEWLYGRLEQSWNGEIASIAIKWREQGEEEVSLPRLKEKASAALAVRLTDEEILLVQDVRERLADPFVKQPDVYTDKFIRFHDAIMEIETPYRATLRDLSGSRTLIEDEREYRKDVTMVTRNGSSMSDQVVSHWLEKLQRVITNVDVFQHIDRMTPRLWMKYNEVTGDIRKLQSFLEHEKGYLDGKIIELGEEIPQKIQECGLSPTW